MVDFNSIKLFDNASMVQVLVYFVFTDCVFNIIIFDLLWPAVVKVMNFASNLTTVFEIIGFVHLRVTSFSKYA